MELYNELKKIGDHLISIRQAENFFFIDLRFPKSWLIQQKLFEEKKVISFGESTILLDETLAFMRSSW